MNFLALVFGVLIKAVEEKTSYTFDVVNFRSDILGEIYESR